MSKLINPNLKRSPYYVVAPPYTRTSAGIRCLHLLCHWLNRQGERAYIALSNINRGQNTNNDLLTPILTPEIIAYHFEQKLRPIVVYPEVVMGNPLEAECVVRWVLNFPGLLGGDAVHPENEMLIAFSKVLAASIGEHVPVLHMPVINEEVFYSGEPRRRSGNAVYGMKYKEVHGATFFGVPSDAIEITRDHPDSQDPEKIAEILRSVEALYVFENTALATEAVLCGCPAVFMPNPWLDRPIALSELGWDGYAWGDDPAEIERARSSVIRGQENYHHTVDQFFQQLDDFVARSQTKAAEGPYSHKINPSWLPIDPDKTPLSDSNADILNVLAASLAVQMDHKLKPRWSERIMRRFRLGKHFRDPVYAALASSDFFDRDWYLRMYSDVESAGIDPIAHYIKHGVAEGRNPGPFFSTRGYLVENLDVEASGINPLLHYLQFGFKERRKIKH